MISGFDPWDVSARALADLIEKEKVSSYRPPQLPLPGAMPSAPLNHFHGFHPRLKLMPPGFTPNGFPPSMANMRHPGKSFGFICPCLPTFKLLIDAIVVALSMLNGQRLISCGMYQLHLIISQ